MLRCAACGRRLLEPAYTAPAGLGGWMLGPVCLEKERAAGRIPRPSHFLGAPAPRKPASTRKPVKRIKRVAQVQDDLFCDEVENVGEVD